MQSISISLLLQSISPSLLLVFQAAIANYQRLGDLNNRSFFSHNSRAQNSQAKVLAGSFILKTLFGLQMATIFTWSSLCPFLYWVVYLVTIIEFCEFLYIFWVRVICQIPANIFPWSVHLFILLKMSFQITGVLLFMKYN